MNTPRIRLDTSIDISIYRIWEGVTAEKQPKIHHITKTMCKPTLTVSGA